MVYIFFLCVKKTNKGYFNCPLEFCYREELTSKILKNTNIKYFGIYKKTIETKGRICKKIPLKKGIN